MDSLFALQFPWQQSSCAYVCFSFGPVSTRFHNLFVTVKTNQAGWNPYADFHKKYRANKSKMQSKIVNRKLSENQSTEKKNQSAKQTNPENTRQRNVKSENKQSQWKLKMSRKANERNTLRRLLMRAQLKMLIPGSVPKPIFRRWLPPVVWRKNSCVWQYKNPPSRNTSRCSSSVRSSLRPGYSAVGMN